MSSSFTGLVTTVGAVVGWYFWSSAVVFSNRHLLTSGLTAPISLTLLHMLGSSIFSNGAVYFGGFERQYLQSRNQGIKVILLSLTFGMSVVCGTATLKFIPVSFNEVICSTTPLFAAVFTFLTKNESQGTSKTMALVLIAIGCYVASNGEPMWNTLGFFLSLIATATRALRTVLGELLMSDESEKLSSMNLLRYMSTSVVVLLLPVVLLVEGPDQLFNVIAYQMVEGNTSFVMWFAFNIMAAFSVNWCQLLVTKYLGSVALQVFGIFKGVACTVLSILIFQNPVTVSSAIGYTTSITGVACYSALRHFESEKRKIYSDRDAKESLLPKSEDKI
eukprot:CAMPEP_0117649944 /NCGR_PEP_ID=MMETSP0804-20121206/1269_1 /TAXON_ID=1074897 /ORGANISM="Tetraselmis astigmatica, Strain CCMP880" /LENGTH=332 /DNA_ID=CAMNT_0005455769 /DNA_START=264 /DNA_END=1262 /DNA_ORIENTATION=-